MRRATAWLTPVALAMACATEPPVSDTLGSLTIGVAAPVLRQASATPLGLHYHRDALTRETLVTLGPDGRPLPRILESWTPSSDGLTWRLKIRPGIRFHDSTPVVAKELAPQIEAQLMAAQLGKIASVDVESNDIIVVRLRERFAFLPEDLGQATAIRTVQETDSQGKPVSKSFGTGPYVVEEETSDRVALREFPNHYRGDPGVASIDVKLFPDQRNAWSALMRDEIDVLYEVSRESLDFVRSESSINVATFPRAYVYLLGFNSKSPALTRSEVRAALSRAIDRPAFVKQALHGEGDVASGHIWPRHWAFDAGIRPPAYDRAEAIRQLEAAGFPLKSAEGRMPARLRLRCLVYGPFRQMALVVQRQLAEIDVELQLEELSLQDYVGRMRTGNFDTFIFEMTAGRTLMWPYLFWHSSSPMLKHGYSGSDDILERMRMATNEEEMRTAARTLQQRMIDDPPAAFLAWGRVSRAVTRRFELPASSDDIYQTIAKWKPANAGGRR